MLPALQIRCGCWSALPRAHLENCRKNGQGKGNQKNGYAKNSRGKRTAGEKKNCGGKENKNHDPGLDLLEAVEHSLEKGAAEELNLVRMVIS